MSEVSKSVNSASNGGIIWGIIVLLAGLFAVAVPFIPGLGVVLMVGIALLVVGVAQFIYAFGSDSFGQGLLKFAFAILAIACGVALLTRPGAGLAGITLFLAAWFVVDGIFALIAGFQAKPVKGWGWMVFSGVISMILGVMIYRQFPESAMWLVGVLVGVRMIFAGWTMIILGSAGKSAAKAMDAA